MTPITKMVFRFIKENLDGNNQITSNNSEIAEHLGVHEGSISRCIGALKEKGVIEIEFGDSLKRIITYKS